MTKCNKHRLKEVNPYVREVHTWHTYGISPGLWDSFMCSKRTCSDAKASSQILHVAKIIENGHMSKVSLKKKKKKSLFPRAQFLGHTWRFDGTVGALDVALQLERSQIFSVAMVASRVAVPALTVLFLQLQVVLHVVHEPTQTQNEQI